MQATPLEAGIRRPRGNFVSQNYYGGTKYSRCGRQAEKSTVPFIRPASSDPSTRKYASCTYPHGMGAYKRSQDAKIGDLYAPDTHRILPVKRDKGKKGMRNLLYLVDLLKVTDITNLTTDSGEPPGKNTSIEKLEKIGVIPTTKKLRGFDRITTLALQYLWKIMKREATISEVIQPRERKHFFLKGNPSETSMRLRATGESFLFLLISLPESRDKE